MPRRPRIFEVCALDLGPYTSARPPRENALLSQCVFLGYQVEGEADLHPTLEAAIGAAERKDAALRWHAARTAPTGRRTKIVLPQPGTRLTGPSKQDLAEGHADLPAVEPEDYAKRLAAARYGRCITTMKMHEPRNERIVPPLGEIRY